MKQARITIYEILKILSTKHALKRILLILRESHLLHHPCILFLLYCEAIEISIMFTLILTKLKSDFYVK